MQRNLTNYRPTSVWDFMSEVEKAFDDIWGTGSTSSATPARSGGQISNFAPPVDLHETADYFLVSLDLPGISQQDVKIDVQNGKLTISGERRREENKTEGMFKRFERSYGRFARSFQLPQNVSEDKIQARMENGVLEVMIPKAEVAKPRSVQIEAGAKGGLFSKLAGSKKSGETHEKTGTTADAAKSNEPH